MTHTIANHVIHGLRENAKIRIANFAMPGHPSQMGILKLQTKGNLCYNTA